MKYICYICKIREGVNKQSTNRKNKKIYIYKICHLCSKEVYKKNKENVRRWHSENRDRVRAAKRKYSRTTRRITSKKQDRARKMVSLAIKAGLITRGICCVCKLPNAQAHHNDYNRPFDIMWFCSKHHRDYEEINGLRKKKYK